MTLALPVGLLPLHAQPWRFLCFPQITPAIFGCFKCWIKGEQVGRGKTVYANHAGFLEELQTGSMPRDRLHLYEKGRKMHKRPRLDGSDWPEGMGPPPKRSADQLLYGCNVSLQLSCGGVGSMQH